MDTEPPEFTDIATLTGSLDRVGRGFGRVVRTFQQVVGPELARVAVPVRLQRGTLVVRCSSASWAQTIGFMELDLIDRIRTALPDVPIEAIRARAGAPQQPQQPQQPPTLDPLDAHREAALEALTATIGDPELRHKVLAAARASEQRRLTPPHPPR